MARAAKQIGTSLEARVTIQTPDEETAEFLRSFGADLHFLLITSGVELGPVGETAFRSEIIENLAVEVQNAPGEKCERCWHYTRDIGSDPNWPSICARCARHVQA